MIQFKIDGIQSLVSADELIHMVNSGYSFSCYGKKGERVTCENKDQVLSLKKDVGDMGRVKCSILKKPLTSLSHSPPPADPPTPKLEIYSLQEWQVDIKSYNDKYDRTEVIYCDPTMTDVQGLDVNGHALPLKTTFDTGNAAVSFISGTTADQFHLVRQDLYADEYQIDQYHDLLDLSESIVPIDIAAKENERQFKYQRTFGKTRTSMGSVLKPALPCARRIPYTLPSGRGGFTTVDLEQKKNYEKTTVQELVQNLTSLFRAYHPQFEEILTGPGDGLDLGQFLSYGGVRVTRGGSTGFIPHTQTTLVKFGLPVEEAKGDEQQQQPQFRWFVTKAFVVNDEEIDSFLPSISDIMALNRYRLNFTGYRRTLECHEAIAQLADKVHSDAAKHAAFSRMCHRLDTCSKARQEEINKLQGRLDPMRAELNRLIMTRFPGLKLRMAQDHRDQLGERFAGEKILSTCHCCRKKNRLQRRNGKLVV